MNPPPFLIVSIDGGAASGKSSTARALAGRFNFLHADTGSFYRALTAELLQRGVNPADPAAVRAELADLRFECHVAGRSARLVIHGDEVAEQAIRSPAVNAAVSHFAALPEVRSALLTCQRNLPALARTHGFFGLVVEGRDIGTVIFPHADLQYFLQADPAERAHRREREGQPDAVEERDRLDASRENAPFACPAGATSIDSTHLTLEQVVDRMATDVTAKLPPA
jgi:cytidylate kinase